MGCNCGKKNYEVLTAVEAEHRRLLQLEQDRVNQANLAAAARMQAITDAENMRQARINAGIA